MPVQEGNNPEPEEDKILFKDFTNHRYMLGLKQTQQGQNSTPNLVATNAIDVYDAVTTIYQKLALALPNSDDPAVKEAELLKKKLKEALTNFLITIEKHTKNPDVLGPNNIQDITYNTLNKLNSAFKKVKKTFVSTDSSKETITSKIIDPSNPLASTSIQESTSTLLKDCHALLKEHEPKVIYKSGINLWTRFWAWLNSRYDWKSWGLIWESNLSKNNSGLKESMRAIRDLHQSNEKAINTEAQAKPLLNSKASSETDASSEPDASSEAERARLRREISSRHS